MDMLSHKFDMVCQTVYNTMFKTQSVLNVCRTSAEFATVTGSITPFWNEQKANIIVTLVKIMTTFCH